MNAIVAREASVEPASVDDPEPSPGEVVVELRAAALNRRDLRVIAEGAAPIPGSDGAGIRRDTGEDVVILPSLHWGDREDAPAPEFRILDGTWAEVIAVPEANLFPKPARLSWHEAAALPLAGLTAWRALFTRAGVRAGETVLVLGAGSGVSTFLVQLARQAGAHVVVTSSSAEKLQRAKELGAERGLNYVLGDWAAELEGAADVVIDSVGATWPDSLRCLRPGGRLVVFGATGGANVRLNVRAFYFGQYSILGTTMGSPREFAALLDAVERAEWRPVIDSVRSLAEAPAAVERLIAADQFGKLVLEVS